MGNTFFSDVNVALGHQGEFYNNSFTFDPTTVPGVAASCINAFEGTPGEDYSSIAIRGDAFFAGASNDLIYAFTNIPVNNYGCEADKIDPDLVRCDWSKIYVRIVQECQIVNIRGAAYDSNAFGDVAGDCEELLGISDKIMEDGVLNPDTEWCPAYYGKEGSAVYASVGISRTFGNATAKLDDVFTNVVENAIGADYFGDTQKIIIDNVPYCTAFDACTDDDFFKLANAEAAAIAESKKEYDEMYYNNTEYEEYIIKIIPDESVCVDSKLRLITSNENEKPCKWVGRKEGRCTKPKFQKHCPETCEMCEDFACVDSSLSFKVSGDVVNCEWVGEDPMERCKKGARTVCRETCGFCDAKI